MHRGDPHGACSGYVWAQGHLLVFAGIAASGLPLGAGIAPFLVAMALIRSATRRRELRRPRG